MELVSGCAARYRRGVAFLDGSDRFARRIATLDGQESPDREGCIHVGPRQPPGNDRVAYFVGYGGLLRGICLSRLYAEGISCDHWFLCRGPRACGTPVL